MLEKIKESTMFVSKHSKYVKINYSVIDKFVKNFKGDFSFWMTSNIFGIMEMGEEEIIYFLLVIHTIGDFCFWGNPKWSIETPNGVLDGYYAFIYLIVERIKDNKDFNMTFEEFKRFGNFKNIFLLEDRYHNLVIMNEYLSEHDFYNEIKSLNNDIDLFCYIIKNFSYFKDETMYKGKHIYFYKRAQLFVSDILHLREILEKIKCDYSHLRGCADYKIPQIMRSLGILEFCDDLERLVEKEVEIEKDSEFEVEIRANTLEAIRYISEKLNVPPIDVNDYFWAISQNKKIITKKYHHTLTSNY